MHLPRNDLEQIRYNAKYEIGEHGTELGSVSVHALAKDLSDLSAKLDSIAKSVSSMRSGVRRAFSKQTELIQDQTTLVRDRFDVHRAEIVSDLTAALNDKMADLRLFIANQRPPVAPPVRPLSPIQRPVGTPISTGNDTVDFLQPPIGHNTPFPELRNAILGTTPIFKVSMPERIREQYGAYISTLKKQNGIDYHYLDASRLPRDRFRSARAYMPGLVRSNPLWCNV